VGQCGFGLAGKDAADDEDLRVRTKCAGGNAFFHAGHAQPARAPRDRGRRAEGERVAVGICLDDGEQLGVGRGNRSEKTEIFFERAGGDFRPAGTRWRGGVHGSVYGKGRCLAVPGRRSELNTQEGQQEPGSRGVETGELTLRDEDVEDPRLREETGPAIGMNAERRSDSAIDGRLQACLR
jgi:hypothetical protein